MADRLEELHSAVRELGGELRRLEARVRTLEGRGGERAVRDAAPIATPEAAPLPVTMPAGTVALVGRTLLVLAGAYVARALTDGRVVPAAAGVAVGLAYALAWHAKADHDARRGLRESAVFHALAGSLIAFPLVWEAAARFALLGAPAAGLLLVALFAVGLAVARRRDLPLAAWLTTVLAIGSALALLLATRALVPVLLALLGIAASLEWLAYHDRWLALRWPAALAVDAVAFLLAALAARPQGLPEGYPPVPEAAAALALLALPALYVAGLAARTLSRGRPVTFFEVAQGGLAVLLGFGGALRALSAHGAPTRALGVLALVLGALCYGAAFAFAERRPGQGRNFYFYSTAGGLLALGGASLVASGPGLPFALGALGVVSALAGRRFGRMTLRVHSALFLAAGALESGLVLACARAVAGGAVDALPSVAWPAALAAATGWAVLATDPGAPRGGWGRAPQALLAALVVFAVGKALQVALWSALGGRAADAAVAAVLRTAILAALALGVALAGRRPEWPELRWLVYPLVALGGVKLLVQDLREGRPATLVLSLALYGAVLLCAPRLLRRAG